MRLKVERQNLITLGSQFLALSLFLLAWQIIASIQVFTEELFPGPHLVLLALTEIFSNGELLRHLGSSLFRVLTGFFIASLLAIPLGLILGWKVKIWNSIYPLIQIFRTISPVSWIPLAILWFGIGNLPAIFIIAMTAFFPLLISIVFAVIQVDPMLKRVARNFGATDFDILKLVVVPSCLPQIVHSMKLCLGICWMIIVAAEMVGMRSGLGYMILDARNFLRTDLVIAGMIIIGLTGMLLDWIMLFFEKKLNKYTNGNIK